MAYKITGIITLYKENQNNTISIAINGDIKSPDGRNLFFKCNEKGDYEKTENSVTAHEVTDEFTIPDKLERVISLIFSNKQKATFLVDDNLEKIEGVEIKQP